MSTKIFINLPIKDLNRSVHFYTQLGFRLNADFSDEKTACMAIEDNIFVMLLTEPFFQTFTTKNLVDANKGTEAILALSAPGKEQVDEMVHIALANGGSESNPPTEMPGMYGWSFQDPDGHLWEVAYMKMPEMNTKRSR